MSSLNRNFAISKPETCMAQGNQVKNGKAFEYAIAKVYCEHINQQGVNAVLVENEACVQARGYYEGFDEKGRQDYDGNI